MRMLWSRPSKTLSIAAVVAVVAGCDRSGSGAGEPSLELLSPPILTGWVETADPALALDPVTGDLLLAWGGTQDGEGWNLYLSRSELGGDHFSPAVRVNDSPGTLHPHAEGAPRLVAAPGVVALFWNNRRVVKGRRFASSDLLFARSTDGGRQWSPTVALHDPPIPAELPPRAHTFHGAAWGGDSLLVVAWLDGRDRDARRLARAEAEGVALPVAARTPEAFALDSDPQDGDAALYAAQSHDLGATWEPANRKLLDGLCPCCRVTLTRTPEGGILGGWRQHLEGGIRDLALGMVISAAKAHAASGPLLPAQAESPTPISWSRLHEDNWEISGCPHSGPGIVVDPGGRIHATWYSGAPGATGVFYRTLNGRASDGDLDGQGSPPLPIVVGASVGVSNPALTLLADGGAVVATNVAADGRRVISLNGISPSGTATFVIEVPDSEGGTHPQLITMPDGRVILAWTESRGGIQRVRLARLAPDPQRRASAAAGPGAEPPVPGNPAPDWEGFTADGERVPLARLRGQVVLLNVWATWCAPCLREMPGLQALQAHFAGRPFTVVGASVDRRSAKGEVVRFADELGITFPILLDPDQMVMSRFRTIGVPETFLIDADGIIQHRWIGEFDPMQPDVLTRVEALLPVPSNL